VSPPAPIVEFLWWRGCPSADEALERLRTELSAFGLDPHAVEVREVETEASAEAEGFVGSPTIRVDGRDVLQDQDEPVGLTCRVYRLRNGRISAFPDPADVREALEEAIKGGGA
jgi:hypothetical protein